MPRLRVLRRLTARFILLLAPALCLARPSLLRSQNPVQPLGIVGQSTVWDSNWQLYDALVTLNLQNTLGASATMAASDIECGSLEYPYDIFDSDGDYLFTADPPSCGMQVNWSATPSGGTTTLRLQIPLLAGSGNVIVKLGSYTTDNVWHANALPTAVQLTNDGYHWTAQLLAPTWVPKVTTYPPTNLVTAFQPASASFTVLNTGNTAATFTLSARCGAWTSQCTATPASVTVAGGAAVAASVNFNAPLAGVSDTVRLAVAAPPGGGGATADSSSAVVTGVDRLAPAVHIAESRITWIEDDGTLDTETHLQTVTVTACDYDGTVDRVTLMVNGIVLTPQSVTATTMPYCETAKQGVFAVSLIAGYNDVVAGGTDMMSHEGNAEDVIFYDGSAEFTPQVVAVSATTTHEANSPATDNFVVTNGGWTTATFLVGSSDGQLSQSRVPLASGQSVTISLTYTAAPAGQSRYVSLNASYDPPPPNSTGTVSGGAQIRETSAAMMPTAVTITPSSGTQTSAATVTLTVTWCDPDDQIVSRAATFEGKSLPDVAVGVSIPGCAWSQTSTWTVPIDPWTQVFTATAIDAAGHTTTASAEITRLVDVNQYTPVVSPVGSGREVQVGSTNSETFVVTNPSAWAATYQLQASCPSLPSCLQHPSAITLAGGATDSVPITFTAPNGYGITTTLALTAAFTASTGASASGSGLVTVRTPAVAGANATSLFQPLVVPPSWGTPTVQPGWILGAGFYVANLGNAPATYQLTYTATNSGFKPYLMPDTSVSVNPGDSVWVVVDPVAPMTEGQVGSVTMTATYSDTTWGAVTSSATLYLIAQTPHLAFALTPRNAVQVVYPGAAYQEISFALANSGNEYVSGHVAVTCSGIVTNCRPPLLANGVFDANPGSTSGFLWDFDLQPGYSTGSIAVVATSDAWLPAVRDSVLIQVRLAGVYSAVAISPHATSINVRPSVAGARQVFQITNTGTDTSAFSYGWGCSGIVTCGGSGNTAMLVPNQATTVAVSYSVGSAAEATGVVSLWAASITSATAADTGRVTVTTVPGAGVIVRAQSVNPGAALERGDCLTIAAGDGAAYECGDLRLVHALPAITTMNRLHAPALIYSSAHANPRLTVAADVALQPGTNADNLHATLTINRRPDLVTVVKDTTWNANWSDGRARRIALSFDPRAYSLPQGAYTYVLDIQAQQSGASVDHGSDTGTVVVVDRTASSFGRGWWLDGLEQLSTATPDSSQLLWIGGDGSTRLYSRASSNSWAVTPALDRPDTLQRTADGGYVRWLRDSAHVRFDATGRHVATVNRQRDSTSFSWSGSTLMSVGVPAPGGATRPTYAFAYGAALGNTPLLTLVTAPPLGATMRTMTMRYVPATALVDSIVDPDTSVVAFVNDVITNRVTTRIGRLGSATTFAYDETGKLRQSVVDLSANGEASVVRTFCAAESRGAASCPLAVDTAGVYTLFDGPRAGLLDTTRFYLNRFGAPDTVMNALGGLTVVTRDVNFPMLAAALRQPNGHTVRATYNGRGLIATRTDVSPFGGGDSPTRYVWNAHYDEPDTVVGPSGETNAFGYDAHGNRIWQQDGRGDSTRVWFFFDANNQVDSVRTPGTSASQRFSYDASLGNLATSTTPLGFTSSIAHDAIGRETSSSSPIDPANPSLRSSDTVAYDLADRIVSTTTFGPPMGYTSSVSGTAPAVALQVTTAYDRDGNPTRVTRTVMQGPGAQPLVRTWQYDAAHRKLRETDDVGHATSWAYDGAGDVTSTTSRRGLATVMSYDPLDRLTSRVTPAVVRDSELCTCLVNSDIQILPTVIRFPYFGALLADGGVDPRVVIPADTATFTYDVNGNVLTADNRDAKVHRQYYANGQVKTDSLRVAVYDRVEMPVPDPYALHAYALNYAYDLSGREVSRVDGVPGYAGSVQSYAYDASSSFLVGTTDVFSGAVNGATLDYDAAGRVRLRTAGTGNQLVNTYDDDDRLVHRTITSGPTTVFDDALTYDARGKVTAAQINSQLSDASGEQRLMAYNGLGALVAVDRTRGGGEWTDEYLVDALGNIPSHDSDRSLADWRHYDLITGSEQLASSTMQPERVTVDGAQPQASHLEDIVFAYDSSGNQSATMTQGRDWITGSIPTQFRGTNNGTVWTRSYYDADERLRMYQATGYAAGQTQSGFPLHTTFVEYRYDALGRRVLMRTRKDSTCIGASPSNLDCLATIDRFVWDGDQIVAELRSYAPASYHGTALEQESSSENDLVGTVRYVHAGGIDQPLFVWKNSTAFVPHLSWRGGYEAVSTPSGGVEGSIYLPAADREPYLANDVRLAPRQVTYWLGSLIEGQQDPSGLVYMRNRYYDPKAGKFTQEDPIGLAGGVNLYGFAAGDPVNYSDPFGLCPPDDTNESDCGSAYYARRMARGEGSPILNEIGGVINACNETSICNAGMWGLVTEGIGSVVRGGTYLLRDAEGAVVRTGRTNNLARRASEHARDLELSDFTFEVDARTDSYAEQRGREQMLHDTHKPPLNKIEPISPNNPKRPAYLDAAKKIPPQV